MAAATSRIDLSGDPSPPRSPSSSLAAASPAPQVLIPLRPLPEPPCSPSSSLAAALPTPQVRIHLRPLPGSPRSPSSSLAAASSAPQVRIPLHPLPAPRVPLAWPRPCSRSSSHRGDARVSAGCLAPAAVPRPAVAGSLTDPTTAALGRMARAGHLAQLQACKFVPGFSITCTAIFAEKFGRAGIQAVLHMKQLQANSVRPGFGSTSRSSTRWMWFT
ncbi:hypothetical protein PVAP13_2NG170100 [Panicum virgatum]|uniref:Uncharacterized protein n=1 Tax=Panicum virgatum TaxID=38727 RepID=A0A8T0VJG8_PANVG|nr:hypothetical protein PVAP13_2NG170100 [Panicum virgatum]